MYITRRFLDALPNRTHRKTAGRLSWTWTTAWVCVLAAVLAGKAHAEQTPAELMDVLQAAGFENLNAEPGTDGQGVVVTFENRRYRWDVVGLGVALAIATARQEGRVTLIPLNTGIPIGRLEVEAADYRSFLRGDLSEKDLFSRMVVSSEAGHAAPGTRNSSFGRVDLTFSPGVRLNLVTPSPPGVLHGGELRLNPGVYCNLWRGVTFDATYTYPLSHSDPVVARAAGSLNARIGKEGYFQVQAGRLFEGVDGFAGQASWSGGNGRHLLGVAVAQAGYPGWERTTSYQAFWTCRPSSLDVTTTLSWGRFMAGDRGYSATLVSAFGESNVEFSYTKTQHRGGYNGEVLAAGFTVPLGRMRQPRPAPVRARFRNAFRFLYTDERPTSLGGGLAVPFMDGYQMAIRRWNRAYLRTNAQALREAARRWLPAEAGEPGKPVSAGSASRQGSESPAGIGMAGENGRSL